MRVLFMGNNRLAVQVLDWLGDRNDEIVAAVVHPEQERKQGPALMSTLGRLTDRVYTADQLEDRAVRQTILDLEPQIGLSILFGYILSGTFIRRFPSGVINLHLAYLPYNRGAYPNIWSIVEDHPAGVSLHYLDEGIDTGDIIARREVEVKPVDTGKTLYRKLEQAGLALFQHEWPSIVAGDVTCRPQPTKEGTYHDTNDVASIDEIDLDQSYRAGDLIDRIRALTFRPHPGAYFQANGKKVFLWLELIEEEDLPENRE